MYVYIYIILNILYFNSPYCQPYNSYDVSSENLVLHQLIIPKLIFFFILITYVIGYCIDIVTEEKFCLNFAKALKYNTL